MRTSTRRLALVLTLILVAGLADLGLRIQPRPSPRLPDVAALVAGTGWVLEGAGQRTVRVTTVHQQWLLHDASGDRALLQVLATTRSQGMLAWDGAFGYRSEGFVVSDPGIRSVLLDDGRRVTVGTEVVRRLADRRQLEYAVAGPGTPTGAGEVSVPGSRSILRTVLELIRGRSGPYYMLRVSVDEGPAALGEADSLLGAALSAISDRVPLSARNR